MTPGEPREVRELGQTALYSPAAHLRLWSFAVLGLGLDLWTKQWAFAHLRDQHVVIDGVLSLQKSLNPGALWGMGQGMSPIFVVASLVALVVVLGVFAKSNRRDRWFHCGLGMIIAGALGNLHDRLFNGGRVRDFIKIELRIGDMEVWPWIFNVADMFLVVGVAILMIHIWLSGRHPEKANCESQELSTETG